MYHLPSSRASVLILGMNIAAPGTSKRDTAGRPASWFADASEVADFGRTFARRNGATGPRQTSRKITSRSYRTSMHARALAFRHLLRHGVGALAHGPGRPMQGKMLVLAGQALRNDKSSPA